MLLYSLISLVKIRNKELISICLKDNTYIMDKAVSPFIIGISNPKIYLTECLGEKNRNTLFFMNSFILDVLIIF